MKLCGVSVVTKKQTVLNQNDSIRFFFETSLKANNPNKYLNKKFWLDSSDRLMYEGKAPELVETKRARMPAFFEHANPNLPQYA